MNHHTMFHQIIVIITQAVEDDRDREARSEDDDEEDEEYDSGGSGVALTPPESPGSDHRPWPWYKISIMMFQEQGGDSCRRRDQLLME